MIKVVYACEGICHNYVTQQEYLDGAIFCFNPDCTMYNRPLKKKHFCDSCKKVFDEDKIHKCEW